ncbi:KipI family sensor histidine kinase inhibitor [Sinomonas atrocyanea]|uniref:5-oxoprolinase subunit B/C family protein n=1 Tax=Sinomonas atrocyanea TaxID=37927 RepID=UPI00277D8FB6|nr:carboxyltransferase domain-containing protein [Sinomonas atrocyanea]MDP9885026.1 KipI family sensor histidine kinase inhibitor [Sinomonas atrocyanea]
MTAHAAAVQNPVLGLRPAGDRAVLVELRTLGAVLALTSKLAAAQHAGDLEVVDVVAAATTVLIVAASPDAVARAAAYVRALHLEDAERAPGRLVQIETVYDGADLEEAARLTGLSPEALVAAHSGAVWDAAFGGFAPGFAYLTHDGAPSVPRRSSPRTVVPAGSVALAGTYSAVYPGESPGGWQLIGRTDAVMWDLSREDPALVAPGDRVQFVPVRASAALASPSSAAGGNAPEARARAEAGLVVVRPGLQTTVQDAGRPGRAALGVSPAGALDRGALRRANRMAGNTPDAAGLEVLLGGLELRAERDQVLAVTGARVPLRIIPPDGAQGHDPSTQGHDPSRGREAPLDAPFALLAGETLAVGAPTRGLRTYVAVRGGLEAERVLGSASTDTLSGIGPAPLAAGDALAVAPPRGAHVVGLPEVPPRLPDPATPTELRVLPGPRQDWFTDASVRAFFEQEWTVTAQSNRVGVRLDGAPLERARDGELTSEGTARGAIQVPASGLPVLFLADAPVTGGYPVIGVVVSADLDLAAQLPPGAMVRFVRQPGAPTTPEGNAHA